VWRRKRAHVCPPHYATQMLAWILIIIWKPYRSIIIFLNNIGLGDGDIDLHRHDWQVNIKDGPTKLVRQDAILGGLSIGQLCKMWSMWMFKRTICTIKLMKGKALGKHSLHEKTAASVLLKLFISSNEWCHTTDAP